MSYEKPFVVGLTAPFGSGCTVAGNLLERELGYKHVRFSLLIREEWEKLKPEQAPTRKELQLLGNHLRKTAGDPGYLAARNIQLLREDKEQSFSRIVFDGIKNLGEIETLKEEFGRNFYLMSLECPPSQRWERLQKLYEENGLSFVNFNEDNERDRREEYSTGQQVELCVDKADVLLTNDADVSLDALKEKLINTIRLVTGETPRYAEPVEIYMNVAYSAAHASKCLKRQVGAVIVEAAPGSKGDIVGHGFNENPTGTDPCVEEREYGADPEQGIPGKCFRDIVRLESFVQLAQRKGRCPNCGEVLAEPTNETPPWLCNNNKCNVDLEDFFWPERAMTLCTAIHAEVAAIMSAGKRARGGTLYTTAFPCFQCAEKIIHAGIKNIVFTEPYPDIRAAGRLDIAGIAVARFEGVRSSRFDEIFSRARPYISDQLDVIGKRRRG